jgi:NADH-quinone oxidoreductase subunit L
MANLPWIILLAPLLSATIIALFTQRLRTVSAAISVTAVLISLVASCVLIFGPDRAVPATQFQWLNLPEFQIPIGFTIDRLSKAMLLVVTVVGSLIHIYSLGYMADDEGKSRYFAGLSIFMFSMLGIVFANNFVMMFIFWELVGVSSYILIGHWFHRPAPPAAANKAFITNRIGDFGFMLGILMVWIGAKSVMFTDIENNLASLAANPTYLTITTLLVFCGAVGKSAQFPLHVWLPDAMEGPTPVSALIHAATMVAAGVYMLSRVFFLIAASPGAQHVIAWIGIITAVLAALMATQQSDIKRILAYSTLSQLGYMVMAVGVASSEAAMFHLFTHAFFKALLFLGSGAVIHALHHEQNIWKMGGLMKTMPVTFTTFLVGTLALTGCPFLSGFYSKDAILLAAHGHNRLIFALALITALLTAFYMFRLVTVAFMGRPRSDSAKHGHEAPPVMTVPLMILAVPSVIAGYTWFAGRFLALPNEEGHGFAVPALALAMFAVGAGMACVLYNNKATDPFHIPLFANKFYIDELYAGVIRWTQDLLAAVSGWFDRWILDGVIVRGISGGTWVTGFVLRFLQLGNLQGYAFIFGVGTIALIYYILIGK